jgi:PAS domain S-box-containing protein
VAKKSENLMLITDETGKILWVNETYETKNNYTAEELNEFTGKYLQDVSKNAHIKTIIKNVVDFKQAFTYESSSKDKQGETYYAMTTVSPVEDDQGTVSNLLFVDTDVTMVKRAQKENEVFKEFVSKSKLPRIHIASNGSLRFANPSASLVLNAWKKPNGQFKDDILAMLQGICDSGVTQDIQLSVMNMKIKLNFHPDKEKQELFIIGESMTQLTEHDLERPGEKRAG